MPKLPQRNPKTDNMKNKARSIKLGMSELMDEESSDVGAEFCPMCGTPRADDCGAGRYEQHSDAEIIHRLALFMQDDWKACCILLLYIAMPNSPVRFVSQHIVLSIGAICEARQRAAERFPELKSILGLLTPDALAKQARLAKEAEDQQELFK